MSLEAERLKRRFKKDRERAEERRARAQGYARTLAQEMGKADPTLRTVIGFGSTFETWRPYRMDSDIDLAIEGGDWGALWSLIPTGEFTVSLIELDIQPEAFAKQVRIHGIVLYEKK